MRQTVARRRVELLAEQRAAFLAAAATAPEHRHPSPGGTPRGSWIGQLARRVRSALGPAA
jgi:hypothetical protein